MAKPFVRNVLIMLSGAGGGHVLAVMGLIAAGRLYSEESFGELAVFTSVVGILAPVAGLRYDIAVMLPKEELEARRLAALARVCIIGTCALSTAAVVLGREWIDSATGNRSVANWLLLVGPTVLLVAELNLRSTWLNRQGRYKELALSKVWSQGAVASGQVGIGLLLRGGPAGLFLGYILGLTIAVWRVRKSSLDMLKGQRKPFSGLWQLALRYKRMPLLNGMTALVDAVRLNGINLMIGYASLGALGQFNMAWRLTMTPLALVNLAIGQVFFRSMAKAHRGALWPLVRTVLLRLLVLGGGLALAIYWLAPSAFPLVLGPQWSEAGLYARALAPWLMMILITSPLSNVFIVTGRQGLSLCFSVLYTIVPFWLLSRQRGGLLSTMEDLSLIMAGLLLVMLALAIWAAINYDRGAEAAGAETNAK